MSRRLALLGAPAAAALLFSVLPDSLSPAGRATTAVALWMAVWWLSEAIPLEATALLPVAVFPIFGVASIQTAAAPYAHKLIFLFMGGFMIASAMERWDLHRRIALWTILRVGSEPARVVAGFMLATAFLSMWVSNTATTLMMVSIALSVIEVLPRAARSAADKRFAVCLLLGIAYAASIGGMATLIGTPPNALLAAFLEQEYGVTVSFGRWMLLGVPLAGALLPVCWWLLTYRLYPVSGVGIPGGSRLFSGMLRELGPMRPPERGVAAVFCLVALAWMLRPVAKSFAPGMFGGLDDAGIAMIGALALFLIPSGEGDGHRLLDWKTAVKIPWGILLIFGGGLSLAKAIKANGVAVFLGGLFSGLEGVGPFALLALVTLLIVSLTELTSNTATTAAFLPIFGAVAVGAGVPPEPLLAAAALAASCAFMMPVATPPNAIVFGAGYVSIRQMARAGLGLNVIAVVLITTLVYALAPLVFG